MAQIETSLYQAIANAYSAIDDNLATIAADARVALDAIVDVNTNDGDPSGDADAALEIELALLGPFNSAYIGTQNIAGSTSTILAAVRVLNNFVIQETAGTDTATVKLNTWINTTCTWANVPVGWKNLCTDAGYTTTTWT